MLRLAHHNGSRCESECIAGTAQFKCYYYEEVRLSISLIQESSHFGIIVGGDEQEGSLHLTGLDALSPQSTSLLP